MTEEQLASALNRDLEDLAAELVRAFGLKHEGEDPRLASAMMRWLDFRLRYIDPRPRRIVVSSQFPKRMTPEAEKALHRMERFIMEGVDVNPYQGKGLTLHNDTSGKRRQWRTDLLWADWGIHHLHLTQAPFADGSYFSPRSDWLLFCMVGQEEIGLIDVRHHDEANVFSDPELIQIAIRSWPEAMERYRLNGVLPGSEAATAAQIYDRRRGGIAGPVVVDDAVYVGPGMGVTTASTPTRLSMVLIRIRRYIQALARLIVDPSGQFQQAMRKDVSSPQFRIGVTQRGIGVFEEKSNIAWPWPERQEGQPLSYLHELREWLCPSWVVMRLNANSASLGS